MSLRSEYELKAVQTMEAIQEFLKLTKHVMIQTENKASYIIDEIDFSIISKAAERIEKHIEYEFT